MLFAPASTRRRRRLPPRVRALGGLLKRRQVDK
jgi:hypothetical protein